jgi:hypothetical protein
MSVNAVYSPPSPLRHGRRGRHRGPASPAIVNGTSTRLTSVPPTRPVPAAPEYVTQQGPWHFTRQTTMEQSLIEEFYALYTVAFHPLKTRSVARQVLSWREFYEQMRDERVVKYVARGATGEALGLTTLTNQLDSVPWISPEYFAERYPEQWARGAVYYLGFTLAHPSQRHLRFIETIIMVGIRSLVPERAVVAFDVCAFNNQALHFTERVASALLPIPSAQLDLVDTQFYSTITFA